MRIKGIFLKLRDDCWRVTDTRELSMAPLLIYFVESMTKHTHLLLWRIFMMWIENRRGEFLLLFFMTALRCDEIDIRSMLLGLLFIVDLIERKILEFQISTVIFAPVLCYITNDSMAVFLITSSNLFNS